MIKKTLITLGLILMFWSVVMGIFVPVAKVWEQTREIHTYHWQMAGAVTPAEYRDAALNLNQALVDAGMVEGNTFWRGSPHEEMQYIRGRILALADRADQLSELELSSVEVSTGLADMRLVGSTLHISPFTYWILRQEGTLLVIYIPIMMLVAGFALLILGLMRQSGRERYRGGGGASY